jgi:hypothetical protein
MQSCSRYDMHVTDENSYCPDYLNREKENNKSKHTLEEFCRDLKLPFIMYYEL